MKMPATPSTPSPVPQRSTAARRAARFYHTWVESGESVEVQGNVITAGLFYLGNVLPFAVDPTIPVAQPNASSGACSVLRPCYHSLSPAERGLYLLWLASGRTKPEEL